MNKCVTRERLHDNFALHKVSTVSEWNIDLYIYINLHIYIYLYKFTYLYIYLYKLIYLCKFIYYIKSAISVVSV